MGSQTLSHDLSSKLSNKATMRFSLSLCSDLLITVRESQRFSPSATTVCCRTWRRRSERPKTPLQATNSYVRCLLMVVMICGNKSSLIPGKVESIYAF